MTDQPNKSATPDKILTIIPTGAEPRDIVMSYGLLDTLVSMVGDIDQVSKFFIDQDTRNKVLTAVLSDRAPNGKVTNKITPDDLALELETVDDILSWAAAHVTGFFIRSLTSLAKRVSEMPTGDIQAGVDAALIASSNGSKD